MQLRDYLRVLTRRWLIVVGFALLGLAVSGAVTAFTARTYSSEAKLFVATATTGRDAQATYAASQFTLQRMSSYTQLSDSGQVLSPVIESLGLHESVQTLSRSVSVTNPPGTVALNVTVIDRQPTRAASIANAVAQDLSTVIETLESARAVSAPVVVSVTERATPVATPVSPRPSLNIALGLITGLILGVVIAIVRDQLDTTIQTGAEAAELTGAQPLGLIPDAKVARRRPITDWSKSTALSMETLRSLRANLAIAGGGRLPSSLVVASPTSRDGRTTLACNLAIAVAQSGARTCLVEADLRSPRVGRYLKMPSATGLVSVLAGRASVDDALTQWRGILSVMLADASADDPVELLESAAMASLLDDLTSRFGFVVLDVPPVSAVTDGVFIARLTQATLLVIRSGKTERLRLDNAIEALTTAGANIIGVAVSGVPERPLRRNLRHVIDRNKTSHPASASSLKRAAVPGKADPAAAPVEAALVESVPVGSVSVEAALVELVPVESVSVESVSVEAAPVESVPVELVPVESVSVESVSVEAAPVLVESESSDSDFVEPDVAGSQPVEFESDEAELAGSQSVESESVEAPPFGSQLDGPAPIEPESVGSEHNDPEPVDSESVEAEPIHRGRPEDEPADPEPITAASTSGLAGQPATRTKQPSRKRGRGAKHKRQPARANAREPLPATRPNGGSERATDQTNARGGQEQVRPVSQPVTDPRRG